MASMAANNIIFLIYASRVRSCTFLAHRVLRNAQR
jgi:hypothetical protein